MQLQQKENSPFKLSNYACRATLYNYFTIQQELIDCIKDNSTPQKQSSLAGYFQNPVSLSGSCLLFE